MKRLVLFAAGIAALASCSKIDDTTSQKTGDITSFEKGRKVTLTVSAGDQTKVSSSLNGSTIDFKWQADDKIKVTVGSSSAEFVLSSGAGTSSAEFTGYMPDGGSTFDVQYPFTTPDISTQTYSSDEVIPHDKMLFSATGCSISEASFELTAQNAVLRLKLWGGQTVGKIVLTDTGSSESSKPDYTLNVAGGKTIGDESGEATSFFIVVPAGEHNFSAEIFDSDGKSIDKVLTNQTFTAGQFIDMPALRVLEGALPGFFSVSATQKVRFSKGNLYYANGPWRFEDNQYDFRTLTGKNSSIGGVYSLDGTPTNHCGTFGWSTASTVYGISGYLENTKYSGDFKDWGENAIVNGGNTAGLWRTLSGGSYGELAYLLSDPSRFGYATVGPGIGIIILPDSFKDPMKNNGSGAFVPQPEESSSRKFDNNVYTAGENWNAMESAGAVFLPAAGGRLNKKYDESTYEFEIVNVGTCMYWSSTAINSDWAVALYVADFTVGTGTPGQRYFGLSVRLVYPVQ